jgi:chorismate synthase
MRMRFLDAGESHGRGISTIIEGCPAGLKMRREDIEGELARRRRGYGRGKRMSIEGDLVEIQSGVRRGLSLGSPITLWVANLDHANWLELMGAEATDQTVPVQRVTTPRPGHADLAGALKYGTRDIRDILERASARETVGRVCAGCVARLLLRRLGIEVLSHVLSIGGVEAALPETPGLEDMERIEGDELRCFDRSASLRMKQRIDEAARAGDTLGGIVEVIAYGVPAGLGSHAHWDRRLDGILSQAVMSIQSVKGVEIGDGFSLASLPGSKALDLIAHDEERGYYRLADHAGGIEGGISNGEMIRVRAAIKPIPTLGRPAPTIDIETRTAVEALAERSDVCAVPAAGVVAESMVAWVLANALLEKTGGDHLAEVERRYLAHLQALKEF